MPDPSLPRPDRWHLIPSFEALVDTYVRLEYKDLGVAMEGGLPESRKRKGRTGSGSVRSGAVRKLPVTGDNATFYRELLDVIEPRLSPIADNLSVANLSLHIFHEPSRHHLRDERVQFASIISCHKSSFALHAGRFSPRDDDLGFYLVYDTLANLVAIVPPAGFSIRTRSKIGAGVGLLCRGDKEGDFVLAEILRHRDDRCREILTNKATLLTWASLGSRSGQWIKKEVLLPLPDEEVDSFCPFIADSVFAIGSTSLCWVDLLRGILVYNHHHNTDDYDDNRHGSLLFHFIPLPEGYVRNTGRLGKWLPQEYRSMCCTQSGQTLKFVSMEDYASDNVSINKVTLRTWTLMCPLRPNHWVWKEVEEHFRIGDLFNDPFYKTKLRLQPLRPCCPVISDVKPGVIYLTVIDQEFNHELQSKKARQSMSSASTCTLRGLYLRSRVLLVDMMHFLHN